MAITITARGTKTHGTSVSTWATGSGWDTFTSQNSLAVLIVAVDNSGTSGVLRSTFTVADSHGNVWKRWLRPLYDPGAASEGVEGAFFTTDQRKGKITSTTTITVSLGSATIAKCAALYEIESSSYVIVGSRTAGSGSATASPTITTSSIAANRAVLCAAFNEYGTEQSFTGDSDTTNGSWGSAQSASIGSTISGVSLYAQGKVVSADGTQTWDPALGTSSDVVLGWIELVESSLRMTYNTQLGNTTSSTTLALNPEENFASGDWAVLVAEVDNSATNGLSHSTFTVTDTKGNTWTRRVSALYDPGAASAGFDGAIFTTAQNGGTLTTSDTVTVTLGTAATNKVAVLHRVASGLGRAIEYVASGVGTASTTTTPSITTGSIGSGHALLCALLVNTGDAYDADTDTTSGDWDGFDKWDEAVRYTDTSFAKRLHVQLKSVYAAGTQTYNPVSAVAAACLPIWIEFGEVIFAGSLTVGGQNVAVAAGSVGVRASRMLAATASNIVVAGQGTNLAANRYVIRPSADSVDGSWTNESGGTDLYGSIDEASATDGDFIQSPSNPVNAACKIKIGAPSIGSSIPTQPMVVAYRYSKSAVGAALDLTVRLLQGSTVIASWTETDIGLSWVTRERTLTAPQFASITDFSDLYIEFEGDMV